MESVVKRCCVAISLLMAISVSFGAVANESAQKLGVCMSDSLNGKERKKLAKWVYLGMSAHSTIQPYSNFTEKDVDESNKYLGALVTRLLTEDCPDLAKSALQEGGSQAFEHAFGVVGQVAMQEIMAESSVSQSLAAFEKYLDQEKFNSVFN
ncbi:hypothetical protein AUP74_01490 [Microbulbifer aggregans]|uniref:Uncharacterized protein n=1 Tax=Microbulbifer aggregans TaxID=1769779 RepID=A0A1C9W6Z8_9GAMM|nr:hypothetical protein [Microbulbifer aggregans]AOS96927.1 hypothetical protein AUP74_01490 [Microbulbifer aggregans]